MKTHRVLLVVILVALSWGGVFISGCGGTKSLATLSAQELLQRGKQAYEKKKYFKAKKLFETIVYNYPGASTVDTAQYYLALSYFGNKEYEIAGVEFNRLILNYPSSVYFEHAVFMKAVCAFESTPKHYGLDQTALQNAIKQFEDFLIDFPESQLCEDASAYLLTARTRMAKKSYENGVVYNRVRAFEAAKIYFQRVIDDYTDTEFAPKASFQYAEIEFKLERFDQARQKFEDFRTVFPQHKWVNKASRRIIEAAFKSGEAAFKKEDYALAERKLQAFQENYPNNGWTKKADKYLKKIQEITKTNSQADETDT